MSAETLRKAAAEIRHRGLAVGRYHDDQGQVDPLGALRIAHAGEPWKIPLTFEYRRDYHALCLQLPTGVSGLPPGNPIPWSNRQTDPEMVAQVFERAADAMETPW